MKAVNDKTMADAFGLEIANNFDHHFDAVLAKLTPAQQALVRQAMRMPGVGCFELTGELRTYEGSMLHDLTHWTGHRSRLDRDLSGRFGSEAYAAEELVAEMGAAFVCAALGIPGQLRHPEYIGS